METRLIATAPVVTGQGHRLMRGDLLAVCDRPQDAELLSDLACFTVVNTPGGFELRPQNHVGDEAVNVVFRSPLAPPIESGTLSAMWRTRLAKIEVEDVDTPDDGDPPSGEPGVPAPTRKPKGRREPKV